MNFHGRAWKYANSQITATCSKLEPLWRWYFPICEKWSHRICFISVRNISPYMKFTYEKKVNNTLPFLRFCSCIQKRNQQWFMSWKRETRRTLVNKAYIICCDNKYLQQELKHLQRIFHTQNGYPMWIIELVMKKVKENNRTLVTTQIDAPLHNTKNDKNNLPYVAVCWRWR